MRTIRENLYDEAREKLRKGDQKRKQTILDDEAKEKVCKAAKKRMKTIWKP